jgi:hypothetical protein
VSMQKMMLLRGLFRDFKTASDCIHSTLLENLVKFAAPLMSTKSAPPHQAKFDRSSYRKAWLCARALMRGHHLCLLKTVAVQEVNRNAGRAKSVAANRGENIDVVNAPQRDVPPNFSRGYCKAECSLISKPLPLYHESGVIVM